ncbi:putative MINDY deubiquitinase [Lupinus albus]|uniref:Putative MINDY deubiquitinase n=1 Tax=Lupinus albus TaxID=3870 RepID=A0A6A4P885_LUPAL|nr:putative MINDY deubiquitinase [Lupinus albus]
MLAMLKINNRTSLMQLICSLGLLLVLIIDDFEFTRECAIFDLLDIPLCHGWIVDPQEFLLTGFLVICNMVPNHFFHFPLLYSSIC